MHRNIFTNDKIRKMARILCQNEYKKDGNVEYIFEDLEVMSDFEIHTLCDKMKSIRLVKGPFPVFIPEVEKYLMQQPSKSL